MKVYKPNTDQMCEVFLTNGDKVYSEYVTDRKDDDPHQSKPNIFESFIPVSDGEQITVNIKFEGTVLHGAADVIADGAFVYDRRIEGDRYGAVKYQKRHWKIERYYNVPGSLDTEAMHTGKAILGGTLLVKSLDEGEVPLFPKGRGKLGLGSLAVIISINQDAGENYTQAYGNATIGNWRSIRANQADGGLKPTHELEFRMEDDEVHYNRQQRHKRHLDQTRFGPKPWAVFVFFYRSQTDIQGADSKLRSAKVMPLDPFIGEFTFADPDAIMKKRLATRARNEREKQEAEEDEFGYDGYDTYSNAESTSDGEGLFVSRSPSRNVAPGPRKRLLGNSLGLPSAQGFAPRKDSGIPERETSAALLRDSQPNEGWQEPFGDAAFGDTITSQQGGGQAQTHNSISGTNLLDDFDFSTLPDLPVDELTREIDQALQAGGLDAPQALFAALPAKMVASTPSQGRVSPVQQAEYEQPMQSVGTFPDRPYQTFSPQLQRPSANSNEEQAESLPLAQLISEAVEDQVNETKAAKTARLEAKAAASKKERPPPPPKGKPVFDPTAKTGYGFGNPKMGPNPNAPTRQAMKQLDAQDTQTQGMLQSYLHSQEDFQQQEHTSSTARKQQEMPYQRPWEVAQPRNAAQHPMSPPSKAVTPSTPIPPARQPSHPRQPSPHTPAPVLATTLQRKRTASLICRESNASKRSRTADKKAALLARLQEKQRARVAAQDQLEEERRARQEMDRRREEAERREREEEATDEAEIARLEAELVGEDAEVEALRELGRKEAEEARMRELEREREGEE